MPFFLSACRYLFCILSTHLAWLGSTRNHLIAMSPNPSTPHHVLDFLVDDNDSCALTVYTEDNHRMHIIADASKFQESRKSTDSKTHSDYARLVSAFRKISDGDNKSPSAHDSAVEEGAEDKPSEMADSIEDAEEALQRWLLQPVRRDVAGKHKQPSLQEWFEAPTQFFSLEISDDDELAAVELEASSELKRRMAKLRPEITLPKYIKEMGLPWFDQGELTVLAGGAAPPPYHPTLVRCQRTGREFFFKMVDAAAPQTTKRELWHLHRVAQSDLAGDVCAPRLEGLVSPGNSKTHAIGFLQQVIPNPTPLTHKLDAEVPQEQRDAWAAEVERMRDALHERKIVWGDAKADNFLVDSSNRLWIIDFGGSWTEGWVDPEIKETIEGDEMGTERIVNALHDPIANVEGASEEAEKRQSQKETDEEKSRGEKRKISQQEPSQGEETLQRSKNRTPKKQKIATEQSDGSMKQTTPPAEQLGEPVVEPTPQKRRKSRHDNQGAQKYCYCDSPSAGPMIGCDGPDCERQWFHFHCAGVTEEPSEDVAWFCKGCSNQ